MGKFHGSIPACFTLAIAASCVKQVTPVGPSRLVVEQSGSDQIVRSDNGAITRDTTLRFRLESLPPLQTDRFQLPLASADGMRLAWQQESNFNWPLLTASPQAPASIRGVVATRGIDSTEADRTLEGAFMLGRCCGREGPLIECPREDGSRWIGVMPWDGGDLRWLVQDKAVNAFASFGPRGELAWSRRSPQDPNFSLVVERPEGRFELNHRPDESWLLPIVADGGIFAMRLHDGTLELAYLPLRAGRTMSSDEARPAIVRRGISLRGSDRLAYQCFSSVPPDRAVLSDGSLLFFHPDLGRMAIWKPADDSITPLPQGALSAAPCAGNQLLVSFRDRLATLSLPVDPVRGPVTVVQEPWIARPPSGDSAGRILLFLPDTKECRVSSLQFN